jgi:hypothetical protein
MNTFSDAAKRCSDIVQQAVTDGHAGMWIAIRLSDGGTDGVIYASRQAAIAYQLHETLCAYIRIPPDGMPPEHAERYLAFHRMAYDKGFRLTDPDDRRELIVPHTMEDFRRLIRG